MPWIHKSRGQPHYVRSQWRNGKAVQEYIGSGPLAVLIAAEDERHRREVHNEKEEYRAWRERIEVNDAAFVAYDNAVTAVFNAAMTAAGYHRLNRGKWRKRRMETAQIEKSQEETEELTDEEEEELTDEEEEELAAQERKAKFTRDLEFAERGIERLRTNGDLERFAEKMCAPAAVLLPAAVCETFPSPAMVIPLMRERVQKRARDLAGPNPTALEELLAERLAFCAFQADCNELALQRRSQTVQDDPVRSAFLQKRADSAHKRCLSAAKTLAQVRQSQQPTVQVNIGERQINVLESPQPAGSAAPNRHPFGLAAPERPGSPRSQPPA